MHCLYIERVSGDKNAEEMDWVTIGEMQAGTVKQYVQERWRKKADKRLLKMVKKHCDRETIIVANERVVQEFELPNTLFELRKQELLKNIKEIMCFLKRHITTENRKRFLLVLHSENWGKCEIRNILIEVQKHYEDIYIVYQGAESEMECLADYFYRECGVVLHLYYEQDGRGFEVDTVLFLVQEWKEYYQQFGYRNGYVIAEQEHAFSRSKRVYGDGRMKYHLSNRMIYAGLAYQYRKKDILYELALPLLYHGSLQHLVMSQNEEKAISIVAIYGLE